MLTGPLKLISAQHITSNVGRPGPLRGIGLVPGPRDRTHRVYFALKNIALHCIVIGAKIGHGPLCVIGADGQTGQRSDARPIAAAAVAHCAARARAG